MKRVQRIALATFMALMRLLWQTQVVAKFGGTSMATADSITRVHNIIQSNPLIRWVVVSAPGCRFGGDTKVTDLLIECHRLAQAGKNFDQLWQEVAGRFTKITADLGVGLDLSGELESIQQNIQADASRDYVASRGEYLASLVMASVLGWQWVDAAEIIRFRADGQLDTVRTFLRTLSACGQGGVVIGGFYGSLPDGSIHTFPRGGSDITGAVLASALRVQSYQNWTDVDGVYTEDPNKSSGVGAEHIKEMSTDDFRSLHELTGAQVVNIHAVEFASRWGIPIEVRSTFHPAGRSTIIIPASRRMNQLLA